jgi:NADPH:quinone reductase-like Zn-dependent oxidoreductase
VQLAKGAEAHVIATASPRSSEAVKSADADEVIDHTTGPQPLCVRTVTRPSLGSNWWSAK